MRVLLVHNYYQRSGGEDVVFRREAALLRSRGDYVAEYTVRNDTVATMSRLRLAANTVWSRRSYHEIRRLARRERIQLVHFHNTLPLISPAGYYAARAEGAAVVQTLHNYRLLCPKATFFRNGSVCEDCIGKIGFWPSVFHGCYRNSRSASAAVATMLSVHDRAGTWTKAVDRYIALNSFARDKFVQGGLPAGKIHVKPNFMTRPKHPERLQQGEADYALFVGRLANEKGVGTLLAAWRHLDGSLPLTIVGNGPLADLVAAAAAAHPEVRWLDWVREDEVAALMASAQFLVVPSQWYEGFPVVVVEAYANGLPIIASNLGGLTSLVTPRRTGLLFRPGDAKDLAEKVRWLRHHTEALSAMRGLARIEFETKYGPDQNYALLKSIYSKAIADRVKISNASDHDPINRLLRKRTL